MPKQPKMKTLRSEGIERLRTLYAILDGIPDQRIDLSDWRGWPRAELEDSADPVCGTVACAFGWACVYPPFMDMGLTMAGDHLQGYRPQFLDRRASLFGAQFFSGWQALCLFFSLDPDDAQEIFGDGSRRSGFFREHGTDYSMDYSPDYDLTDRQKVMRRIRRYLLVMGVITTRRNAELSKIEGVPA